MSQLGQIFDDYLFSKGILVSSGKSGEPAFESLFSLANLFGIRITENPQLADPEMIRTAERCLGRSVPAAFYRGFPQTVKEMAPEALLFDQLVHYFLSYTLGIDEPGASLFEPEFQRLAFKENTDVKDFIILPIHKAQVQINAYTEDLLSSTRPLSESQLAFVEENVIECWYRPQNCAAKDTAVNLLLKAKDRVEDFADFLQLSDVIRVVEQLNYQDYSNKDMKKLNLSNRDRKFITRLIDHFFLFSDCNIRDCFEKKKLWNGLLHHIHYNPINEEAQRFVDGIRGKENISVYSQFETKLEAGNIQGAVTALRKGKGSGAVLRNLTYILSRCKTQEDVEFVFRNMETNNGIILLQLIRNYSQQEATAPRTFKFTKFNLLRIHNETDEEYARRCSLISSETRSQVVAILQKNLEDHFRGKLGRVYIDPAMKKIALPLQETTSSGGYGILPKGSRLPIRADKKIRCFTYWEKVDDIDLSVIGITADNRQIEFSWRSMYGRQSDAIAFSGDQTRGYNGGSEFFDVDLDAFRQQYPNVEYLVFCNNVFSGTPFSDCVCRAGYMDRDILDSGEIFEPKTVATSFTINCQSTFAYLFAVDLKENELVWLNLSRDSNLQVAGMSSLAFLKSYFHETDTFNVYNLLSLMASEVVEAPEDADVIVTDEAVAIPEGAERIRSCDFERILALMNS